VLRKRQTGECIHEMSITSVEHFEEWISDGVLLAPA